MPFMFLFDRGRKVETVAPLAPLHKHKKQKWCLVQWQKAYKVRKLAVAQNFSSLTTPCELMLDLLHHKKTRRNVEEGNGSAVHKRRRHVEEGNDSAVHKRRHVEEGKPSVVHKRKRGYGL
jgi:hypothetical protein